MPSRSSRFNAGKLTHEVRDKANAIDLPSEFYRSVADVVRTARARAYRAINTNMVAAYWDVGRKIVEEEQNGAGRAEYGARLIKTLAFRLTAEFGNGIRRYHYRFEDYLNRNGAGVIQGRRNFLRMFGNGF